MRTPKTEKMVIMNHSERSLTRSIEHKYNNKNGDEYTVYFSVMTNQVTVPDTEKKKTLNTEGAIN